MNDSMIISLKTDQDLRQEEVGNKSYHLHRLYRSGYQISDGYVLKSEFFLHFCKENKIVQSQDTENQIKVGYFFEESKNILLRIYEELIQGTGAIIVRSSGLEEDGEDKSYAGIYESFTNIISFEQFLVAIKKVWSSFYSVTASAYGKNNRIKGIPILIQVMIPCDKAGVAFSRNPVNNEEEIIVEACEGSNEKIILGDVKAQKYVLPRKKTDVLGTSLVKTEELNQIKKIIIDLENMFHFPCDIEWGIQENIIYLFQVRPIVLHAHPNIYTEPCREYEECILLDRYAKPASVCYLSILDSWQKNVYLSLYQDKTSVEVSDLPLCFLQNRVYWNMKYQKKYFHDEEGSSTQKIMFEKQLNTGYISWYERIKNYCNDIASFNAQIQDADQEAQYIEILEHVMDNFCNYLGIDHFRFLGFAQVLYKRLRDQYQDKPEQLEQALKLVGDISNGNKTVQTNEELMELIVMIKENSELKTLFEESSAIEILNRLQNEKFKPLYERFMLFVNQHGHRGIDCDDLYYPHWGEAPEKIIGLMKNLLECSAYSQNETPKFDFTEELLKNKDLQLAGKYMCLRENQRYYFDMSWTLIRKLLLKISEHFIKGGILTKPQEIFHMTIQEIRDVVNMDGGYITSDVVRKRKDNFTIMGEITPVYVVKDAEEITVQITKKSKSYKCTGLSVGQVSGRVIVIQDMESLADIKEGDIAVVSTFHPSWTPILEKLSGMIMNYGNMLSHGAVVAREYGIPVVVFNGDATKIFHNGETVEINGTTGRIRTKN